MPPGAGRPGAAPLTGPGRRVERRAPMPRRPPAPRPRRGRAARRGPPPPRSPWPRRAASSGRVPERELRGERRGVRAARAVRAPSGVALSRDRRDRPRRRRTGRSPSSRWPPVTTTYRRPERVHRARELVSGVGASAGRRAASARASATFGVTTVARGSRRSTSASRALGVEQDGAGLGDHHRVDDDGGPGLEERRAPRRRPRSSRRVPSIPIFTASTPMSSRHRADLGDDHLGADRVDGAHARPCSGP